MFLLTFQQDWFGLHIPQDTALLSLGFEGTVWCNEDVLVLLVHSLQVPTEKIHKSKRDRTNKAVCIHEHKYKAIISRALFILIWFYFVCIISKTCWRHCSIILMSFHFVACWIIIVAEYILNFIQKINWFIGLSCKVEQIYAGIVKSLAPWDYIWHYITLDIKVRSVRICFIFI